MTAPDLQTEVLIDPDALEALVKDRLDGRIEFTVMDLALALVPESEETLRIYIQDVTKHKEC